MKEQQKRKIQQFHPEIEDGIDLRRWPLRLILVLNLTLTADKPPLTLPPSFLHVTLTTPYRSTIAITSLARFMAKCEGKVIPDGEFGSDVEGSKPLIIDVGMVEGKVKESLALCRKRLGDDVTILYDLFLPSTIQKIVMEHGKKEGGPWNCHMADTFFGWEAERVVVVKGGADLLELITRAKTHLVVVLVEVPRHSLWVGYERTKKYFLQAASLGLCELVQLGDEVVAEKALECIDLELD